MYRYVLSPVSGENTASGKDMFYRIERKKKFLGLFSYWSNTGALMKDRADAKAFVEALNKDTEND